MIQKVFTNITKCSQTARHSLQHSDTTALNCSRIFNYRNSTQALCITTQYSESRRHTLHLLPSARDCSSMPAAASPAGIGAVELQRCWGHIRWPHLPCSPIDHVALIGPPVVHLWDGCRERSSVLSARCWLPSLPRHPPKQGTARLESLQDGLN